MPLEKIDLFLNNVNIKNLENSKNNIGYVYCLKFKNIVKIGSSTNPQRRRREIIGIAYFFGYEFYYSKKIINFRERESCLLKKYRKYKTNDRSQ